MASRWAGTRESADLLAPAILEREVPAAVDAATRIGHGRRPSHEEVDPIAHLGSRPNPRATCLSRASVTNSY